MGACMSTPAGQIAEEIDAYQETLGERMARAQFSLDDALAYATQLGATLRDMHAQGLVYGAVSAQLILVTQSGAALRDSGGLAHLGAGRADVTAFGTVLEEMLRRATVDNAALEEIRQDGLALAVRSQEEPQDMRQVLIGLRLLGLRARQSAQLVRLMLVPPPQSARRGFAQRVRMSLQWSAIFAIWAK